MPNDIANEGSIPIVGIGASAGGLEAFEQFFSNMPSDSGMAFVLVSHLDPTHKSILSDLIKRYTRMKVLVVKNGMEIYPDQAYIIPPNHDMKISRCKLFLSDPSAPRGLRLPIDFFFRSLAIDQQDRAICIVLSGTGTDGTLGLRDIKGVGGMAMVQEPTSAKYDGMPVSAINNSTVDYILPPNKMPEQLLKYVKNEFRHENEEVSITPVKIVDYLEEIFSLLKFHTNHDFSGYKQKSMLRSIERRMIIHHFSNFADYLNYIKEHNHELGILFKELLIGVTNFFRDPEAFELLSEKIIPTLIKNNIQNRFIRIWVPGCSTGEEAYSIAILFQEYLDKTKEDIRIQIFASDIDDSAVEKARIGIYPDNIAADVSQDRLEKYFTLNKNIYQVKKDIREKIIFAVQNVISDPPFSKVDLISCRNLLIYLNPEIQKKLLRLFHYSLNIDGLLFLGNSETTSGVPDLFSDIHRKWKIFQRKEGVPFVIGTPRPFPPLISNASNRFTKNIRSHKEVNSYRDLMETTLLKNYSPPSVIINDKGNILYFHGKTSKFLEVPSGEAKMNIYAMAKEGIKLKLTTAIRRVLKTQTELRIKNIKVKSENETYNLDLVVIPIETPSSMKGLLFLSFEETPLKITKEEDPLKIEELNEGEDDRLKELEDELNSTKQYLQITIEELETSNEELKSTNEELQSANEELQSTNEELQTSKEELQSVNEELTSVNTELEVKIDQLTQINNDMNNLMISSEIGTIFLNLDLKIKFFTPSSTKVLNLIPSDIGRPLHHISSNLIYDHMIKDTEEVLETLIPKKIDVQTKDDSWYNVNILPYRTLDHKIDGVVITFSDITKRVLSQIEKLNALEFAESIIKTIREPLIILNSDFIVVKANKSFFDLFKVSSDETLGVEVYKLGNRQWDISELHELLSDVIPNKRIIENYKVKHTFDSINERTIILNARELTLDNNKTSMILLCFEDITERSRAHNNLKKSELKYKEAYNRAEFYKDLFTHDINNILQVLLFSSEIVNKHINNPQKIDEIKKLALIIKNQVISGQNLVNNINMLSQVEHLEDRCYPIDIINLIETSIKNIKKSYSEKNINIEIHEMNEKLNIIANELFLGVINNILINSVKHNTNEIINIDIKLSKDNIENKAYIKIEFIDNGPGIKDDYKELIFHKRFQKKTDGLGIGLSIVTQIVVSLGGKIWVENKIKDDYSKGSNFIVLIPEGS